MKFLIAVFAISLLLTSVVSGQEKKLSKTAVVIPTQVVSPLVAYQPDCPLRIEDITLFQFVKGGGGSQSFKVRNTGTRAIRSYTIGTWNSVGTGWQIQRTIPDNLQPGDVFAPQVEQVDTVTLTNDLKRQLHLEGETQAIVVFVVVRVEFSDGAVYDGEPLYRALKTHLDKLSL